MMRQSAVAILDEYPHLLCLASKLALPVTIGTLFILAHARLDMVPFTTVCADFDTRHKDKDTSRMA
jgi:hypothetical protein